MSAEERRLSAAQVTKRCEEQEVAPVAGDVPVDETLFLGLGQERFDHALALCVETKDPLHNVAAVDISGAAAYEVIAGKLKQLLKGRKLRPPKDVCYHYNFDDPHNPQFITTRRGEGKKLRNLLIEILSELKAVVPHELAGARAEELRKQARTPYETWMRKIEADIRAFAHERGFAAMGSLNQWDFIPLSTLIEELKTGAKTEHAQGKQVDDFTDLTDEQHAKLNARREEFVVAFEDWTRQKNIPQEARQRSHEAVHLQTVAERVVAKEVIERVFDKHWPSDKGGSIPFRGKLLEYAIASYRKFVQEDRKAAQNPWEERSDEPFLPFELKVFVDHSETGGDPKKEGEGKDGINVPIVAEPITSLSKAIGSITRGRSIGPYLYSVDHRNLSPGYFHVANGGYLILNAKDLMTVPGLWQSLKDVIRNQVIPVAEMPFSMGVEAIRPEPLRANLRVILFGPAWIIHLISSVDEEFGRLFKIRGEVLTKVKRTPEQLRAFRSWLDTFTSKKGIHSLHESGVCALIEHSQRLANSGFGDQESLSTDFDALATLMQESNLLCGDGSIRREHIEEAIRRRVWRSGVYQQRRLEFVREGGLLVRASGEEVGQINGLTVSGFDSVGMEIVNTCRSAVAPFNVPHEKASELQLLQNAACGASEARMSFGFPTRITARASLGKFAIVNIHKEIQLAGPLFQKADLTVQGLLRGLYGKDQPIYAHVTYAFEQSYGPVDGDSASAAKFLVLTSVFGDVPLKQGIAITGSANQWGEIQPIGGVNEKIEGWFDVCKEVGELSGEQGVVIPHQNIRQLMLREDIVKAIENKKFHIWAVKTLDEAIEIFTGAEAREYHTKVKKGLEEFAKKAKASIKKTET